MARRIKARTPRTWAGLGFNPALPAVVRWQSSVVQRPGQESAHVISRGYALFHGGPSHQAKRSKGAKYL